MPAFLIANINRIKDEQLYRQYAELAGPMIARHGGKLVAGNMTPEALEGGWSGQRVLLFEFPDRAALDAWYASDEYAPLIDMRKTSADIDLLTLDGAA